MTMSFVIERSDCQMSSGLITTDVSYAKKSCQTGSWKLSSHSSLNTMLRSTCEKVNPIYTRQQAIVTSPSKLGVLADWILRIGHQFISDPRFYELQIFNPIQSTDWWNSIHMSVDLPFYILIFEFKIFNFAQSTK